MNITELKNDYKLFLKEEKFDFNDVYSELKLEDLEISED